MSITLSPTDIKNLILLGKEVLEKYLPWIIKRYNDAGHMPSLDDLESMLGDIKEPDEYYNTFTGRMEKETESYFSTAVGFKTESLLTKNIVTYKIMADDENKLKKSAKLSCNFWNHFLTPANNIVIRLGIFYSNGYTIARCYKPYTLDDTIYSLVEHNTKYLKHTSPFELANVNIHEIGHSLGIGWDKWMTMFDGITGRMKDMDMYVETDYGPGTQYSHWDEERYSAELMTGIQDPADLEYLKPETIKVMEMLGHTINECPAMDTPMKHILRDLEQIQFTRSGDITPIDLDHFEQTDLMEERIRRGGK